MSKNTTAMTAVLGLVVVGLACAPPSGELAGDWTAEGAMEDLVSLWDETLAAGDVDRAVALYVPDDPWVMPPDFARHIGPVGVEVFFRNRFEEGGIEVENRVDRVLSSGDLVVGHGTYTLPLSDESGVEWDEVGKWTAVTRRRPDGSLAVLRNLWNRDAPPPGAAQPLAVGSAEPPTAAPEYPPCADSPSALDAAFLRYWEEGAIAELVEIHGEQASRLGPGRGSIDGREAVGSYLQAYADLFSIRQVGFTGSAEVVDGDLGCTWGRYHTKYKFASAPGKVEVQGKFIAVSTRGQDGCWRYEWVIWNLNKPWPEAGP